MTDERAAILTMLARHRAEQPEQAEVVARIEALVRSHSDCFVRTCLPGHVTGSAFVVSADHRACLLLHHRKLDRWLQPGGHADGDPHVDRVALREAREESGIEDLELWRPARGELVPLDVDVHRIPAHGTEPEHEHHDVRFLVVAPPGADPSGNDESHEIAWVALDRLEHHTREPSVLRLREKALRLLR